MAVSLTTRLGLHRWSADSDPWARSEFDGDNANLEDLVLIGLQGLNASRPAPGVQRRLYTAADSERVYIDDGDEWYEFGMLGTANTWLLAQKFSGQIDAPGGIASSVGALNLPDDVAVGGNLSVAGTFDGGQVTTIVNPFTPGSGNMAAILRKQGKRVQAQIIYDRDSATPTGAATWNSPGGAAAALWMPPASQEAVLTVVGARAASGGAIVPESTWMPAVPAGYANTLKVTNTGAVQFFAQPTNAGAGLSTYALVYSGSWMIA